MCELTCFGPSVTTLPCCWRGWLVGNPGAQRHRICTRHHKTFPSDENETAKPSEALPHPSHTWWLGWTLRPSQTEWAPLCATAVTCTRRGRSPPHATKSIRRHFFAHAKTTKTDRFYSGFSPRARSWLGSCVLRAAGGEVGGARGRGGTEDIPTLQGHDQTRLSDYSFKRDSDAHLHKPPRRQMGRGGRTSILQSTNPAADIEERYSSGVTQPSVLPAPEP